MSDIESTETRNDFGFSGNQRGIAPMLPVVIHTKQQAYRTAAWIKLMSEILPDEFPATSYEDVETAIANT